MRNFTLTNFFTLNTNLLSIIFLLYNNCSQSTQTISQENSVQNTSPAIREIYQKQISCSGLVGRCNSDCLEKYPARKYSPRNSSRRVSCEEDCYKFLREEHGCIFYQATSYR